MISELFVLLLGVATPVPVSSPPSATPVATRAPVPVAGGTKAQQERLQKAIAAVPSCLQSCESKNAFVSIHPAEGTNAHFFSSETQPRLQVGPTLIEPTDAIVQGYAAPFCASDAEIKPYLQNLDSWVLHEYAHQWDFQCHTRGPTGFDQRKDPSFVRELDGFLKLRYAPMRKALSADKEYVALMTQYAKVGTVAYFHELSATDKKLRCEIMTKVEAIRAKHGVPERHTGDTHALDESLHGGEEYFAIAIQTLVYQPDVFCKNYSAAEMSWLRDNMGGCLAQMPALAPCYVNNPYVTTTTTGPVTGGKTIKR